MNTVKISTAGWQILDEDQNPMSHINVNCFSVEFVNILIAINIRELKFWLVFNTSIVSCCNVSLNE